MLYFIFELFEIKKLKAENKKLRKMIENYKKDKKKPKKEIDGTKHHHQKRECYLQSIVVGGWDGCNGLGGKPNNHEDGDPIISPPVKLSFDPSSLLSYSAYGEHSVLVMSDGSLKGIGNNMESAPLFRKRSSMTSPIFVSKTAAAAI